MQLFGSTRLAEESLKESIKQILLHLVVCWYHCTSDGPSHRCQVEYLWFEFCLLIRVFLSEISLFFALWAGIVRSVQTRQYTCGLFIYVLSTKSSSWWSPLDFFCCFCLSSRINNSGALKYFILWREPFVLKWSTFFLFYPSAGMYDMENSCAVKRTWNAGVREKGNFNDCDNYSQQMNKPKARSVVPRLKRPPRCS